MSSSLYRHHKGISNTNDYAFHANNKNDDDIAELISPAVSSAVLGYMVEFSMRTVKVNDDVMFGVKSTSDIHSSEHGLVFN